MSVISAIYKAPVVGRAVMPDAGEVSVIIKYNNRIYQGVALLHPEDKDFFSEKVGYNIAISRARIEALEDALIDVKNEAQIKRQMLIEVTRFGRLQKQEEVYDPTGMFEQNVNKVLGRVKNLEEAIKKEKQILQNYLEGQSRALESIKLYRKRQKKDETN